MNTEARDAIRLQFRRFMERELAPATPALEAGTLLPYPLARQMEIGRAHV